MSDASFDPLNPYAVTTDGDEATPTIHFHGTETRDDLMVSLHDAEPKTGLSRLSYPFFLVVIVAVFLVQPAGPSTDPWSAFNWILMGGALVPLWLRIIRYLGPTYRQRVQRLNRIADAAENTSGFMNDDGIVIVDSESMVRFDWRFFASPLLFKTHLVIPLGSNQLHRLVLPWRFFRSPADAKQACELVRQRCHVLVNGAPKHDKIWNQQCPINSFPVLDADTAMAWDHNDWPFESDANTQSDHVLELRGGQSSSRFAILTAASVSIIFAWYFLPVWLAVAGWLLQNFRINGDWDFVLNFPEASLIVFGPCLLLTAFFIYTAGRSVFKVHEIQSQTILIRIRDRGIHLAHPAFKSWVMRESIDRTATNELQAGWVQRITQDEVQFPKECFDSPEAFEQFCSALDELMATPAS